MPPEAIVPLPGSILEYVLPNAEPEGEFDQETHLTVTIHLVREEKKEDFDPFDLSMRLARKASTVLRPNREICYALEAHLEKFELPIQLNEEQAWIRLAGPASTLEKIFGIRLFLYPHDGRLLRVFKGPLFFPVHFAPHIESVSGLAEAPLSGYD